MNYIEKIKFFLKIFYIFFVCLIPISKIKIFLINLLPKIKIKNSKIGIFNIFLSKNCLIENSRIGHFNIFYNKNVKIRDSLIKNFNFFLNFKKIIIYEKSIIGSFNRFMNLKFFPSNLILKKSQVSNSCFFEMTNSVILRKNVVFGGHESKILNKRNNTKKKTFFNENIFIGSKSLIILGSSIFSKNVTIGACTVINKNINKSGKYFSRRIKKLN